MVQIITTLKTDVSGRGSYEELVEFVENELEQNFTTAPGVEVLTHDIFGSKAREIVNSILNRLDIEVQD